MHHQTPKRLDEEYTEFVRTERARLDALSHVVNMFSAQLDRLDIPVVPLLNRRLKLERERFTAESDDRYEQLIRRHIKHAVAHERRGALTIAPLWILQAIAIITGRLGAANSIHQGFYSACAAIFPILVVAGFVELAARRSLILQAGVHWQILSFMAPATAGEMACLYALAHNKSTTGLYGDVWLSLVVTVAALVGTVVVNRSIGFRESQSRVTRPARLP
jgi:hypothetical protein